MTQSETGYDTLEEYKAAEFEFHSDLMNVCRKYIHKIGIASIMGIIDIVKNETIDLEGVTRPAVEHEKPETEMTETADNSFFSRH